MKILTINTRYIGGGGAAYIANILHNEINKIEGYSSTFLYGRGKVGDSNSFRIIYPKMDYISALSYRVFASELNLNKNIEKQIKECDIVHLHNIHGYYINYVNLFKLLKKYNKKIIWTLHDMWPFTGRCAYSFGCEAWKDECGKCKNLKSYPSTFVDKSKRELKLKKQVINYIDKDKLIIVTPSKWLADICRKSFLNKYKIYNIPNGIKVEEIQSSKEELREKFSIPIDKKMVLFVAADTRDERKGIGYIMDIIPKCPDYIFVSIGKEIESVKLCNFIQLGYISERNKINEIYKMADLFVIPSIDDNFPTTVLESLANGTPVIGFNQGGIPEQVEDNVGIVIDRIESEELKNSIDNILNDESKLKEFSHQARVKYLENYTLEKFIDSYLEIYKK